MNNLEMTNDQVYSRLEQKVLQKLPIVESELLNIGSTNELRLLRLMLSHNYRHDVMADSYLHFNGWV